MSACRAGNELEQQQLALPVDKRTRYDEMREQCIEFDRQHPEVWRWFCRLTFDLIARGFKHYAVNSVFERIRWELDKVGGDGKAQFKLNNNYRPFYARRFMRLYPEHDGFFRTREQSSRRNDPTAMRELGPGDF